MMVMSQIEKVTFIIKILKDMYPNATCSLKFKKNYEFLIAVRLSAQCTDKRVNLVCEQLFKKYTSIQAIANAKFEELYQIIRPCGMGFKKTNDTINICKNLIKNFNYKVPNTLNNLLSLPGVGRKTANLVLSHIYNQPTIVVDTHMLRISNRLGLTTSKNPKTVELKLDEIIPTNEKKTICHRIIEFGRQICTAKKPECKLCPFQNLCIKQK